MAQSVITYCPFYDLSSPVLQVALGVVDRRTIRARLLAAGVPVRQWAGREVVLLEDLISSVKMTAIHNINYQAQSDLAKSLIDEE